MRGSNILPVIIVPGFISNREDVRKLKNEAFQDKIALAVKEAVTEYFQKYSM